MSIRPRSPRTRRRKSARPQSTGRRETRGFTTTPVPPAATRAPYLPVWRGPDLVCIRSRHDPNGPLSRYAGSQPVYWPPEREVRHLWLSAEHLFQAARFPRGVLGHSSAAPASGPRHTRPLRVRLRQRKTPAAAHALAERHTSLSQPDWTAHQLEALRWTMELRLYWNHHRPFGRTLVSTRARPIILVSTHDTFWGAVEIRPGIFQGHNHYGRILAEVRDRAAAILAGKFSHPDGYLR